MAGESVTRDPRDARVVEPLGPDRVREDGRVEGDPQEGRGTALERPADAQARDRAAAEARNRGHRAGTPLDPDAEPANEKQRPPGRFLSLALFVAFAAFYIFVGFRITIDSHVVVFDALDRLARAYLVWHNDPPKLSAIGFAFPPLTTFVFLPFALIKPVATSLIALPITTAIFAAGAIVWLDRTLARCDMPFLLRLPLLLLFGLNPLWVFYAVNGMSEAVYLFFLAFALYCFVSWYETTEPRFLIGAGFGIALLCLTRYGFIIWAGLIALLIGVALVRRRASRNEVEGSVVAFAAPVIYVLAMWILFNALIVGDPFGWVNDTTSTQAINSTGISTGGDVGFDDVSQRLLELNVAVFPLAFAVVPMLVFAFLGQRNDMALWLASFIVLGIVIIGVHAYAADNEGLLTLRDALPMALTSLVGAAWLYRSFGGLKLVVLAVAAGLLIVNLFTAWRAMDRYPFQSLEQAFTRAVESGDDQEGRPSRGGFTVGIRPEAQIAEWVKANVDRKNSILTDNAQTFGAILLSGRPQLFFDRIDRGDTRWQQVLANPYGRVDYLLYAQNERGGDLITRRYFRRGASGSGFTPVFRTERYTIARVARTAPAGGAAGGAQGRRQPGQGRRPGGGSQQSDGGTFRPAGS